MLTLKIDGRKVGVLLPGLRNDYQFRDVVKKTIFFIWRDYTIIFPNNQGFYFFCVYIYMQMITLLY